MAEDTGKHYRFKHTVILTATMIKEGQVTINLDPYRIAQIYGMTDFAMTTILKKCLCAGNRGHNSMEEDLKDIICSAERKLQMIKEDKQNETPKTITDFFEV